MKHLMMPLLAAATLLAGSILPASADDLDASMAPGYDYASEKAHLQSAGYTIVETLENDQDPRKADIRRLFFAPVFGVGSDTAPFKFAFHDFDADGHDELVISASGLCDVDGCAIFVFSTRDGSAWRKVLDTNGLQVAVAPASGGEFPLITVLSPGFSHDYEYGQGTYVRRPRLNALEQRMQEKGCFPIQYALGTC